MRILLISNLRKDMRRLRNSSLFVQKTGGKTKIIISYHNLKETPALTKLKEIFHQCVEAKPAIVKIVTIAKTVEDNLSDSQFDSLCAEAFSENHFPVHGR